MHRSFWNPRIALIALGAAVAWLGLPASAQVTNFSIFKVTVYHQAGTAPPAAPDVPNAYYFGAQLNTVQATNYVDVYFDGPATSEYLNEITPFYYNYGSPYYADKPSFDADFPGGEYDFYVDHTNYTESGAVMVPAQALYATNAAAVTPDCWTAMQAVDPSRDFTLNFNSFIPSTNTTSAFTFVDVPDSATGSEWFGADFMAPDITTTNIPANTLLYGETYRVNLFFSNRQDTQDAGFGGALGTVGFDNLTYTTLITIPPWLNIAGDPTNIVLTWPALAINFALESTFQLPVTNSWSVITNQPLVVGETNWLSLPAASPAQFFRLSSLY